MYKLKFVSRHSTLIVPSLTACRQSIAASIQMLPVSVVKLAELPNDRVDMSGETVRLLISLRLAVGFLHAVYIKYKQMLVFNFIFDLFWTANSSSVGSLAFLWFCELK